MLAVFESRVGELRDELIEYLGFALSSCRREFLASDDNGSDRDTVLLPVPMSSEELDNVGGAFR